MIKKQAIKIAKIGIPSLIALVLVVILTVTLFIPMIRFNKADKLFFDEIEFIPILCFRDVMACGIDSDHAKPRQKHRPYKNKYVALGFIPYPRHFLRHWPRQRLRPFRLRAVLWFFQ